MSNPATTATVSVSIEELRKRKAEREDAASKASEALEYQALALEDEFSSKGKLGVDFDVVSTAVGNFVVRKPEFIVGKRFADSEKTAEDISTFVDPLILFPEIGLARGIIQEHGGIAYKLANSAVKLWQGDAVKRGGK